MTTPEIDHWHVGHLPRCLPDTEHYAFASRGEARASLITDLDGMALACEDADALDDASSYRALIDELLFSSPEMAEWTATTVDGRCHMLSTCSDPECDHQP